MEMCVVQYVVELSYDLWVDKFCTVIVETLGESYHKH